MAPRISQSGLAFLKCAFASPDFNMDPGKGIPDTYMGKTLTRKDNITQAVSFTAGVDTFILVTPTPGIAYWTATVPTGTYPTSSTTFTPVAFPGAATIFNNFNLPGEADNDVNAFRYASMNAGIYPTSNHMQFSGSITVWKIAAKQGIDETITNIVTVPPAQITASNVAIAGLNGVTAVPCENYAGSFIDGVYTVSGNSDADFDFSQIWGNVDKLPVPSASATTMMPFTLDATSSSVPSIYGWGKMDTIVMRVSTPTGAVNSAILKCWACVEYKPTVNSALYQFAGNSPDFDPVALAEYRRVLQDMPLAVTAAENAKFWETIKRILGFGLGIAMTVPGPVGQIATGVAGITAGLGSMGFG